MILESMLQRLYQGMLRGPSLNARPHNSRQRLDLFELRHLAEQVGTSVDADSLDQLLTGSGQVNFPAKVPAFHKPDYPESEWSDEQTQHNRRWTTQQRILRKLGDITTDAQDYYNDHGEQALYLGFPILSLPPRTGSERGMRSSRVLAPLAFAPIDLIVRKAAKPGITLRAIGEGADLVVPNPALLTLIEQQTGRTADDLFADENAEDPWREIEEIIRFVVENIDAEPLLFTADSRLSPVPKAADLPDDPVILPSTVLGLYPMRNPGLMRDTKWMIENESALEGPVCPFLSRQALVYDDGDHLPDAAELTVAEQASAARDFSKEYFVSHADPCQSSAVHLAEDAPVLVLHGPPGTGKSQTIVNIIGNHLARGERVLFVCDKRTALDVVKYRLDAIGLGQLCGVIHDPQRDRKDFYMGLRAILEELSDARTDPAAKSQLEKVNERLNTLHGELRQAYALLHDDSDGSTSYHDLVGLWLQNRTRAGTVLESAAGTDAGWLLERDVVERHQSDVFEIMRRAREAEFSENPWAGNLALRLEEWISTTPEEIAARWDKIERAAADIDAHVHRDELIIPSAESLSERADKRLELAELLAACDTDAAAVGGRFLKLDQDRAQRLAADWQEHRSQREQVAKGLDRELALAVRGSWPSIAELNVRLVALDAWQQANSKWTRIFAGGKKKAALAALAPLGISTPDAESVERASKFYSSLKARLLIRDLFESFEGQSIPDADSDELPVFCEKFDGAIKVSEVASDALAEDLTPLVERSLNEAKGDSLRDFADRLKISAERCRAIETWSEACRGTLLMSHSATAGLTEAFCSGGKTSEVLVPWKRHLPRMEAVLRLEANLDDLPESLRPACHWLAGIASHTEDDEALAALEATAIHRELKRVLEQNPQLAHIDTTRIDAAFDELNERLTEKQVLTRAVVAAYWTDLQRYRLLAATGSRLNSEGAGLRQRLLVRGKRALKLRQMVAAGRDAEGGDPLFDLCPVWMASADTVAQIFPREAMFDAIVFDEASQCRLEEALPILLRGRRVVIAGDPRQLPPTRFFEAAIAESDDTDAETADELHEQQMSETEDLLAAALNLDVHEAFLDVHYRSRNEALIGFSNEKFYHNRLQPIPGHPKHKALAAPIRLLRVDGTYHQQTNPDEAEAAVELISELLDDPHPPSIGVASFNLKQRSLILDRLEARAAEDREFSQRLEVARQRRGDDSFEGLFVKNLENVQGDERDHIIISTTFGPDEEGKFRRNFGALSRTGGERRLNVLVTRARSAIHVLTSIPREDYSGGTLPGPGESINGRHLLYAYLRYAERLAELFESYQDHLESLRGGAAAESEVLDIDSPSKVAVALGSNLASAHRSGNMVHWGNDGFCIDIAMTHPHLPEDVTIGVLTDFNRFRKTPDPIDWERFRSLVFRTQGWDLHRLWSPRLLRDPSGELQKVVDRHLAVLHTGLDSGENVAREN